MQGQQVNTMQIMPSQGGWTNAAAGTQLTSSEIKSAKALGQNSSVNTDLRLEQSAKAGDRDANERYDGNLDRNADQNEGDPGTSLESSDLLSLPALEIAPPSTLDLMG
jgi:hypothetical protein